MVQTHSKYYELPITATQPRGWLRAYLHTQREGLTGYLETAGFPFDQGGWGNHAIKHKFGATWWPYEQNGYWLDGMLRCGVLLRDDFLIEKARQQVEYTLEHADEDGYLGPAFMKQTVPGERWAANRWPHTIFFRALAAYHQYIGEDRVVQAVARHYLSVTASHSKGRDVTNVETMCWAYDRSGDARLLDLAVRAFTDYQEHPEKDTSLVELLSDQRATIHGVTYNEIGKLGAVLYRYTGRQQYLDATINAYRKIDLDQMLVDGVNSSTEALRGKDPLDSHETCDIADYTWGVGYLLLATGAGDYGDKIERACFNAAPGAVRSDFKGLQYFSCPNQVVATATSNHNMFHRGQSWMSYRPNPGTECCPGEVNRIMPNYVSRMWLSDGQGGLAAALYGPSQVIATVGAEAQPVTILEETEYPFSNRIEFTIKTHQPVEFPLSLRIPGWCEGAELSVNGKPVKDGLKSGAFFTLERLFADGDRITLRLPMRLRMQHWPREGVSLERGPLVYALRIDEDWRIDPDDLRSTPDFPAWDLYPASTWNYALAVDPQHLDRDIEVVKGVYSDHPWSIASAPLTLRVPARRVKGWSVQKKTATIGYAWGKGGGRVRRIKGNFIFTPQLPNPQSLPKRLGKRIEMITLVPYGCAKLRITIFPNATSLSTSSKHGK
jgi:hypothetical protein